MRSKLPSKLKSKDFFDTKHLKENLKEHSAKGGVITVAAQPARLALSMIANIALARLLTPQDYGLVGMVAAVTGFIAIFKDLGLSAATIQKDEISHAQVSNLFWINVALGVVTASIVSVLSPAMSWFYGEPRLIPIALASALSFIFSAFGIQHMALLNRQMAFKSLILNDLFSQVIGISAGIVAAMAGLGYWALIIFPLVMTITSTVGYWVACSWRPGLPTRGSGVRSMIFFGANLAGFGVVNYFARSLDNVLIGRYWGAAQLGLYSKAYQLLLLPLNQINSPIASVTIPALSRLVDSPDRYRDLYLRILEKVALVTVPFMVFMMGTSNWLVEILMGEQWSEASDIFVLLGMAGLLQPIASSTGWLFISQGRSKDMFQWGIVGSSITMLSFVLGIFWGASGVAASYAFIFLFVTMPLLFWFVGRTGPITTFDFYKIGGPIALASAFPASLLILFRYWEEISNPWLGCSISSVIVLVGLVIALSVSAFGRAALVDLWYFIRLLASKKNIQDV